MDHPVTGPGSVKHNLQTQLNTRKIHGDFDAGKAPIPAHPGRSTTAPTLKTPGVQVTGPAQTHIESILPMPILERPALAQTEWAWRRLLIQLLSGFAQAHPSGSATTQPPSSASEPHAGLAETHAAVAKPQPPAAGEPQPLAGEPQGIATHPEDPALGAQSAAPRPLSGVSESQRYATKRPPDVTDQQASAMGPQATMSDQSGVIRTLWSVMIDLAASPAQDEWHTPWNQAVSKLICLPFSELKAHHLESLPEKVRQWVLSDRLNSSVQTNASVINGEGILLIPAARESASEMGQAIRWKAERQSKPGFNGVLVHRLRIECQVGVSPVELTITFAKPYLMVHAATNDARLREDFEVRGSQLVERLKTMGVRVERFSVGSFTDEETLDD